MAFPFGTKDTNLDPGFVSPLLEFTFNDDTKSIELEENSDAVPKWILPDGVWSRRDCACRENKMVSF